MIIKNNKIINKLLTLYRNAFCDPRDHKGLRYNAYLDYQGQEANDFILNELLTGKPLMISKFGTVELDNLVSRYINEKLGIFNKEVINDYLHYNNVCITPRRALYSLCNNAGFFPQSMKMSQMWYQRMINDIQEVDILGSYIYEEKYVSPLMNCKRVNIEGYFAPYMYDNPWSQILKGKKVLVVHPFVESIKSQYENRRSLLFKDPMVLPEFKELILIKAVQTMADSVDNRFSNWFEALKYMENEIDQYDYDIALIGCGAYGMCLAAHVKRMGKQAIHLASMTQMLFGIYGKRWLDQEPEYRKYINEFWVRPNDSEKPFGANKVEGACYW